MDSITQAALGAVVGEAILGQRLGNRAVLWGAILGTLPDLDIIANPFLDTAGQLVHHRGASHSILVMVLASIALAPLFARLWTKAGVSRARAGWFVFAVWSTHVLIDCFTVYGTVVLWPFSDVRVGFNNLFIIDFFYTVPLLVAIAWLLFLRNPESFPKRARVWMWSLGISTFYVLLSLIAKGIASAGFADDLERRGITYDKRMEAATPFNIFLWRAVVDRGDEILVGYRTIFESFDTPIQWKVIPRGREALAPFAEAEAVRTLTWFSQDYWIARPIDGGLWIGDVRFNESFTWDDAAGTVAHSFNFGWVYRPSVGQDPLSQVESGRGNASQTLDRMVDRIQGDSAHWNVRPRLIGIPDAAPEALSVIE